MPDPISLGRSVVVGPNDVAPGEWSSCERVRVTAVNRELADLLGRGDDVRVIDSIIGHDAFLVEHEAVGTVITEALES